MQEKTPTWTTLSPQKSRIAPCGDSMNLSRASSPSQPSRIEWVRNSERADELVDGSLRQEERRAEQPDRQAHQGHHVGVIGVTTSRRVIASEIFRSTWRDMKPSRVLDQAPQQPRLGRPRSSGSASAEAAARDRLGGRRASRTRNAAISSPTLGARAPPRAASAGSSASMTAASDGRRRALRARAASRGAPQPRAWGTRWPGGGRPAARRRRGGAELGRASRPASSRGSRARSAPARARTPARPAASDDAAQQGKPRDHGARALPRGRGAGRIGQARPDQRACPPTAGGPARGGPDRRAADREARRRAGSTRAPRTRARRRPRFVQIRAAAGAAAVDVARGTGRRPRRTSPGAASRRTAAGGHGRRSAPAPVGDHERVVLSSSAPRSRHPARFRVTSAAQVSRMSAVAPAKVERAPSRCPRPRSVMPPRLEPRAHRQRRARRSSAGSRRRRASHDR